LLRQAGARILALARAPDASSAILRLLRDPETPNFAAELALIAPHPSFARTIDENIRELPAQRLAPWFGALARIGTPESVAFASQGLDRPEQAPFAALALARIEGASARDSLTDAARGPARRWVARALVVRQLLLGDSRAAALAISSELLASKDDADRSLGAWGVACLDEDRAIDLLRSGDAATLRGAARTALAPRSAIHAAARFEATTDPELSTALALALADTHAATGVSTRRLLAALERGGPAAPLIAKALAERDAGELRPIVTDLLQGEEPSLRAHAALGLGSNPNPASIGRLETQYRFETHASVRRSIVRALSLRRERGRRRVLELAARLDPDTVARSEARAALAGARLAPELEPHQVFWLALAPTTSKTALTREVVVRAYDLSLPVVSDADGGLVLTRLPAGELGYEVAPSRLKGHPRQPARVAQ
jgi:hypothetical protein